MPKATVLIVEDEPLIAFDLQDSLRDLGYAAVAAISVAEAMMILDTQKIDFAVLDYRVGQQDTGPIAERLIAASIPFAVCSAAEVDFARSIFREAPMLGKPYRVADVQSAIEHALRSDA